PEEYGERFALAIIHAQHRDTAVGQPARVDAQDDASWGELPAVHDEVDYPAAPREPGRLQVLDRLHGHLDDLVLQGPGVTDRPEGLPPCWALPGRDLQTQLRPGVVVRRGQEDLRTFQPGFLADTLTDRLGDGGGKPKQVAGDHHAALPLAVLEDQGLDVEVG